MVTSLQECDTLGSFEENVAAGTCKGTHGHSGLPIR